MKATLPQPETNLDPALEAVLCALEDGGDWREDLSPDSIAEGEEWETLARELGSALRMGPGGLETSQREAILSAASHPVFLHTGAWTKPVPEPARAPAPPYRWIAGAAAAMIALLLGARHIPVTWGINPAAWDLAFEKRQESSEPSFHVRLWPGENFVRNTANVAHNPLSSKGDWSAVGTGGGFQPTAMANVSEVVPALASAADTPLADLLPAPIGAGRASTAALIQHFRYSYPAPESGEALSLSVQTGPCPWRPGNQLVHVGIQASSDPRLVPASKSLAVRDLRLLIDFNPSLVSAYRLVGYGGSEPIPNQPPLGQLRGADLLAGQSITAIYEIVPTGPAKSSWVERDKARWEKTAGVNRGRAPDELLVSRINYRLPGRDKEFKEQTFVHLNDSKTPLPRDDFEFSAAVAACALLLDRAPGMQHYRMEDALALARSNIGPDPDGRRAEFIRLLTGKKQG
ncbi:MAG: YfbK domain-containing protein [Verrucomicrobiales bacterium]